MHVVYNATGQALRSVWRQQSDMKNQMKAPLYITDSCISLGNDVSSLPQSASHWKQQFIDSSGLQLTSLTTYRQHVIPWCIVQWALSSKPYGRNQNRVAIADKNSHALTIKDKNRCIIIYHCIVHTNGCIAGWAIQALATKSSKKGSVQSAKLTHTRK